jgi:hypothetical protein
LLNYGDGAGTGIANLAQPLAVKSIYVRTPVINAVKI